MFRFSWLYSNTLIQAMVNVSYAIHMYARALLSGYVMSVTTDRTRGAALFVVDQESQMHITAKNAQFKKKM